MNNKLYIVKGCYGRHEIQWYIAGVFNEKSDADLLAEKLDKKAKDVQDNCPIRKTTDEMSDEEETIYWRYHVMNEVFMEWNNAKVYEYELNKEYDV